MHATRLTNTHAQSPRAATAPPGGRRRRLAIFTSHPVQYHVPLFRELAARGEVEPVVFFASRHGLDVALDRGFGTAFKWDVPLLEGYSHEFVENHAGQADVSRFGGIQVPQIRDLWARGSFDACLVMGWQSYGHLQAMRAARSLRLPLLIRGESHLQVQPVSTLHARLRTALWLPVRRQIYRRMFEAVQAVLTIGTRNQEYYRHFGVPDSKMYRAPYCVDNAQFALPEPERSAARAAVRAQLGVGEQTVVIASAGKLIARKRPLGVLEAFRPLVAEGRDVHLLYVGDGPERDQLEVAIAASGLKERVSISGFINQSQLAAWYAAADCLVLASSAEQWGLVVNEGMAAGLPVIVSDVCGCAPDLVSPGANGYTFAADHWGALTERLRRVAALDAAERGRMGESSRQIVARYTIAHAADAVVEAVSAVCSSAGGSR